MDYELSADDAINGGQLVAEVQAAHGIDIEGKYGFIQPRSVRVTGFDGVNLSAVVAAHVPDPLWAPTPEEAAAKAEAKAINVDIAAAETKARSVWTGASTYTTAQSQKILAGLVLHAIRNL